jgi:DNA-binding LacI/PurR family transcriptional regulator
MRQRVRETAREMGHHPDPFLSALAHYRQGKRTKNITAELAWLNYWPNAKQLRSYREFDFYWQGASTEAELCGYRLTEFIVNKQMSPARLQSVLQARNVHGILIPPAGGDPIDWGDFQWGNFCVVRFGHSVTTPRAHLVSSDQLTDGIIAFENIWNRGYRQIGLVTSEKAHTRFSAGYLHCQTKWPLERLIPILRISETGAPEDLKRLKAWLQKYKAEAILTDLKPMRSWLKDCGYHVPRSIGLATFSVLDGDADSGIDQNSKEIGRAAMQLLISLINHQAKGLPEICREVLVEGRWVDGTTLPQIERHVVRM